MMILLKAVCLAVYALAMASLWSPLYGAATIVQYAAVILLASHLLEAVVFFKFVRRYPGSLAISLLLTLLFGLLHWRPLSRQKA